MRLLLLLFILNIPILLISQRWKPAEWVTSDGQRNIGKVKIPTFIWGSSHYIDLKKEGNIETIIGKDIIFLRLLEPQNDTLIISPLFNGEYHKLQKIVTGDPGLYFELNLNSDIFFIFQNGTFEEWDRTNITEDLTEIFDIYGNSFSQKTMIYNQDIVRRLIRKLNRPKKMPLELAFKKWRYNLGYFTSIDSDPDYYYQLLPKKTYHINMGVERSFKSIPFLSIDVHLSYSSLTLSGIYRTGFIRYDKELKASFLKLSSSLRLEFFPQRRISPFISSGYILSIPTEFKRILTASNSTPTLGGLPSRYLTKATFSPEGGKITLLGLRFFLSTRTRLNIMLRLERFKKHVDFSTFNEPFSNLKSLQKTTPDEGLIGVSLTHAF